MPASTSSASSPAIKQQAVTVPRAQQPAQLAQAQQPAQLIQAQRPAQLAQAQQPVQLAQAQRPAQLVQAQRPAQQIQAQHPAQLVQAQHPAPAPAFDWTGALYAVNAKARTHGYRELPPGRVGRIIEDGRLTGLLDTHRYALRNFICFDELFLMARVHDLGLIGFFLYDMATFYIGKKTKCAHPDDVDLSVETEMIKEDGEFIGWTVLIRPKALPGNNGNAGDNQ